VIEESIPTFFMAHFKQDRARNNNLPISTQNA